MSWPTVKIGDVATILPGFAFKSKHLGDAGVPVVKIGNISDDGSVDIENIQYLPDNLQEKRYEKYALRNRDVIIAMTGATAGKVGRLKIDPDSYCFLNQRVAKFVPEKINADFLWHIVGSPFYRTRFYALGGGAAQPNMSGPQIASVEIPLPPRPQQDRIASILLAYDDLIENNRRRIALLEEAARLLYREWFIHFRFPGHEHTKIIDGVPEGWVNGIVEDALVLQRGFDLPVANRVEVDVPVYGSTGIVGYHNQAKVMTPTLITGRSGSLGQVILTNKPSWPLNTALWVKEFKAVSAMFGLFILRELNLVKYNGGASVPTLDRKVVHKLRQSIPPRQLMDEFETVVSPHFRQIDVLTEKNAQLAKARDLLLPRLMDGRIEV